MFWFVFSVSFFKKKDKVSFVDTRFLLGWNPEFSLKKGPGWVGSTRNSCGDPIFGSTDLVVPTLVPLYTKKTARTSPCLFLRDSMTLHLRCRIFWSQSICMCFLAVQCEVCVFISTDMGPLLPVSPFHHVDALPICRVVSKSCKGSTGGFGR